jgi:hypothetical protein
MTLSEAELSAIAKGAADDGDAPTQPPWTDEMRHMLDALADLEFRPVRASPLVTLCEAGARYGWRSLETATNPKLLAIVSSKARTSLKRDLQHSLERLTRPCLELVRTSFGLAMNSIGTLAGPADPKLVDRMFLGDKPSHRLFVLFKEFPVLARLWSQSISQWREHVTEIFLRLAADRRALAHTFLGGQSIGRIVNIRCNLSDSHHGGRTVMELQFEAGSVIYKPRPGDNEWEWGSLLEWMNAQSFQPKLRVARILRRHGYCWMERIDAASCKNAAALRRFYKRIGGMIAAAYLLRAVDCHRQNLIASGEYPVLVDTEALWHVSPLTRRQTVLARLSNTGFFPDSDPRSLRSRSSVLGQATVRKHLPLIGPRPANSSTYKRQILNGFNLAWHCILGTHARRNAFAARLRRIRSRERRWIYWSTERYAAIRKASIEAVALRSGIERQALIGRLSNRTTVDPEVIKAEIEAVKGLDIPHFVQKSKARTVLDAADIPGQLREALERVLG